jgi:hypothetical protein
MILVLVVALMLVPAGLAFARQPVRGTFDLEPGKVEAVARSIRKASTEFVEGEAYRTLTVDGPRKIKRLQAAYDRRRALHGEAGAAGARADLVKAKWDYLALADREVTKFLTSIEIDVPTRYALGRLAREQGRPPRDRAEMPGNEAMTRSLTALTPPTGDPQLELLSWYSTALESISDPREGLPVLIAQQLENLEGLRLYFATQRSVLEHYASADALDLASGSFEDAINVIRQQFNGRFLGGTDRLDHLDPARGKATLNDAVRELKGGQRP